ncbi:hypothetical protein E2C01_026710 [Portunus trituberculatus]|uniref:Uncharacterized protein n=1 Tax=Portunus trituberculatus TaxID=210409 RepID=A0A5B7EG92_PORTR|nr:hypothetical protein [Portunus trituberculatus]
MGALGGKTEAWGSFAEEQKQELAAQACVCSAAINVISETRRASSRAGAGPWTLVTPRDRPPYLHLPARLEARLSSLLLHSFTSNHDAESTPQISSSYPPIFQLWWWEFIVAEKNEANKEDANKETETKEEEKKEEEKKEKKVKKKKSFRSFSFLRREKKVAKVENTNGDVAKEEVSTAARTPHPRPASPAPPRPCSMAGCGLVAEWIEVLVGGRRGLFSIVIKFHYGTTQPIVEEIMRSVMEVKCDVPSISSEGRQVHLHNTCEGREGKVVACLGAEEERGTWNGGIQSGWCGRRRAVVGSGHLVWRDTGSGWVLGVMRQGE